MALNMHKKGLAISNTISDCKEWKIWKILCLQAVNLAPKMDRQQGRSQKRVNTEAMSMNEFWLRQCPWLNSLPRYLGCLWWLNNKNEKQITEASASVCLLLATALAGVRHGTSLVVRRVSSGRPIAVLFRTIYAFPRQIKPGILKLTTSRDHSNLLTVFSFVNCEEKGCYRVVSLGHLTTCRSYCGRSCRMQGCVSMYLNLIPYRSFKMFANYRKCSLRIELLFQNGWIFIFFMWPLRCNV